MTDTTRVFYVRDENRFPVAVVVSSIDDTNPALVKFGVATYSPKDKFDRTEGKRIAAIRMISKPHYAKNEQHKIKSNILERIATKPPKTDISPRFPTRAMKAAKVHLDRMTAPDKMTVDELADELRGA